MIITILLAIFGTLILGYSIYLLRLLANYPSKEREIKIEVSIPLTESSVRHFEKNDLRVWSFKEVNAVTNKLVFEIPVEEESLY
jgi:hypothetical protein